MARLLKARREAEVLTIQEQRTLRIFQRGQAQAVWNILIGMGLMAYVIIFARVWMTSRGVPF